MRLYTHVMVGIAPVADQAPAAAPGPGTPASGAPLGLPQPGHPERLAADTPLSPDEQLWAMELA